MSVVRIYYNFKTHQSHKQIHKLFSEKDPILTHLVANAALCNRANFQESGIASLHIPLAERKIVGDATDSALLRWVEDLTEVSEIRSHYRKFAEIPFSSKTKVKIKIFCDFFQFFLLQFFFLFNLVAHDNFSYPERSD